MAAGSSFRKENLRTTFRRVSAVNNSFSNNHIGMYKDVGDLQHLEPEIVSWSNCQEIIMRLLQGNKVDTQEKIIVSASVRHLISNANLANLLCESIQRQLLPQAFRGLIADVATSNNPLKQLSSSWSLVYTIILPDFQIVLSSLTEYTKFDTKKVLMTAFRDSLLIGYPSLENRILHCAILSSELWQMLLILEFTTRDNSEMYRTLQSLCSQNIVGFEPIVLRSVSKDEENCTNYQQNRSQIAQSLPKSPVFKTYSRVTWAKEVHDIESTRRHSSAQCSAIES